MKYGDIHLHALDQFDSQNDPDRVCKKLKEMGARAFALTQHGVLSGIEPMREAAARYGLKFVPGIETYYGNEGDLIVVRRIEGGINGRLFSVKTPLRYSQKGSDSSIGAS